MNKTIDPRLVALIREFGVINALKAVAAEVDSERIVASSEGQAKDELIVIQY